MNTTTKLPTTAAQLPRQRPRRRRRRCLVKNRPRHAVFAGSTSRRRRFHPGTVALREIRRMQRSTDTVILRAPFARLVRRMVQDLNQGDHHMSSLSIQPDAAAGVQRGGRPSGGVRGLHQCPSGALTHRKK